MRNIILIFSGLKELTGKSLSSTVATPVSSSLKPQSSQGTGNAANADRGEELTNISQKDDYQTASNLSDLQEKAIGFLAQTICSTRRHDYNRDQVAVKIKMLLEACNSEDLREWILQPRVAAVASTLSLAMSANCNKNNINDESAKRAFGMMDAL